MSNCQGGASGSESRLLDVRETAGRLGICERTLWNLTAPRGLLACVRMGRKAVRYNVADLDAFIEAQTVKVEQ